MVGKILFPETECDNLKAQTVAGLADKWVGLVIEEQFLIRCLLKPCTGLVQTTINAKSGYNLSTATA